MYLAVFKPPFIDPLNTTLIISFVFIVAFTVYGVVRVPRTKAFFSMAVITAIYVVLAAILISILRFGSITVSSPEVVDFMINTFFYIAPVIAFIDSVVAVHHLRLTLKG